MTESHETAGETRAISRLSKQYTPPHGGQLRQVAARFGIAADHILDFSANINPDGPPLSVFTALHDAIANPANLAAYPDLEYSELKQSIGAHTGVPIDCISVGNGFVPLLQAALRITNIERCLLPVPAFSEYRISLEQAGIRVTPYPLEPMGFLYEPATLLDAIHRQPSCDALLLANPQNPSGALCEPQALLDLVKRAANLGVTVLLDEAFIDYAPHGSLIQASDQHENLILFRSVTKFFAIPGLRVAYCVSHRNRSSFIHGNLAPWSVTTLAANAVRAALADGEYQERARSNNRQRRERLIADLTDIGLEIHPAYANFVLARLPEHIDATTLWSDLITHEHILARSCANFEGLTTNHLRLAVRNEEDNQRLAKALKRRIYSDT
jgi:threonine-phosphate decarboxylase